MSDAANNLQSLIGGLCEAVPQIRQAVVVSSDGLPLASSDGLGQEAADRLAAVSSGMIGLAYGSAGRFGSGAVSNVIVEMENGWFFVTGIRGGSLICCLTEKDVDMSTIAFEMSIFVQRVGESLTPDVRYELKTRLLGRGVRLAVQLERSGRLIRPYAMTGGRTGAESDIALEAQVFATPMGTRMHTQFKWESAAVIDLTQTGLAVIELAALLKLPIGVVRVVVGDLREVGAVIVANPAADVVAQGGEEYMALLQQVLDGIKAL